MKTTHHRLFEITWVRGGECVVRSQVNGCIVDTYRTGAWGDTGRMPDDVRVAAMAARPTDPEYADDYAPNGVFDAGDRVEVHPGLDLWAAGAKFGTVTAGRDTLGRVVVKMDNRALRKRVRLMPDRLRHVR